MRSPVLVTSLLLSCVCWAQWTTYETGSGANLHSADAAGQIVLVAGDNVVYRSTDGGNTWIFCLTLNQAPQGWGFHDIEFADATTVYCTGGEYTFKSTDAGANWTQLSQPTSNALWSVAAPSANTVLFGGVFSTVLRSTNGGSSFTTANTPGGGSGPETNRSLHFTSNSNGFSATGTRVYRTQNGGASWTIVNQGLGLEKLYFSDAMNGCVVGYGGRISTTSDGGLTWTPRVSGTTNDLQAVHFFNSQYGTAVGWAGTILRTNDGGVTWFTEPPPTIDYFESVVMLGPTSIIIGGQFGTIYKNGALSIGVDEPSGTKLMGLSPNPVTSTATLALPTELSGSMVQVDLYDQLGRKALHVTANAGQGAFSFDTSTLEAGEYVGVVLSNGAVVGRVRMMRVP